MAERRMVDETTGESYQVAVSASEEGVMTISVLPVLGGTRISGSLSRPQAKRIRYTGQAEPLGEGLTLEYGVFRNRGDVYAGYMLTATNEFGPAKLFISLETLEWLTQDPEEYNRRLQESRPAHRYGTHISERFGPTSA